MTFRVVLRWIVALWIVCLSLAGVASAQGQYVFVTDPFPPYVIVKKDKVSGILIELIHEAFKGASLQLEIKVQPWKRSLNDVKVGKADAVFPLFYTEERTEFLLFSKESLGSADIVFMTKVDSDIVFDGNILSVAGHPITVANGYNAGSILENAFDKGLLIRNDIPHSKFGIKMLRRDRIDILSDNAVVLKYLAKAQNELEFVKILEPKLSETPLKIGYSKSLSTSSSLRDAIDIELVKMKDNGFFARTYEKYTK